jgi:IclR family KDG regulon transcriptional repressor
MARSRQRATNCFRVLDLFSSRRREIRVSEVAKMLRVHPSTASRLLGMMQRIGVLTHSGNRASYRPGLKLIDYARFALDSDDVRRLCRAHIEKLGVELEETVNLGVVDRGELVTVDEVLGRQSLRYASWIGRRDPWHCTSMGKAVMGFQSKEIRVTALRRPLERVTSRTVVNARLMSTQLEEIRSQGYAIARGELEEGVNAVAAPISQRSKVTMAVCVVGPSFRLIQRIDEIGRSVLQAAKRISEDLNAQLSSEAFDTAP